jgi:3-deoxy-D-manno-octulosonate 8-phosphate phosphatase (KDO 8-P phosphatase)
MWESIKLLVLDVDGVLTDGTIEYRDDGATSKRFHTADGLGIVLIRLSGVKVAWISGKRSAAVENRAGELFIDRLCQGVRDKRTALMELQAEWGIVAEETAYVGDDWNDLPAFEACGVKIAVANAVRRVKQRADFITTKSGGNGAVREIIDTILHERGIADEIEQLYLESLIVRENVQSAGQ